MSAATPFAGRAINAVGFLAETWGSGTPGVIVNPAASPLAVLCWCYGELASMASTLDALACGGPDHAVSVAEWDAAIGHHLRPVTDVLRQLVEAMICAEGGAA